MALPHGRSSLSSRHWVLAGLLLILGYALWAVPGSPRNADSVLATAETTGTLRGTIRLEGSIPTLPPRVKAGDTSVKDCKVCAAVEILNESFFVDPRTNGIANVFVYLAKTPAGYQEPHRLKPLEPAIVTTIGCRIVPHTLLLRVGQPVVVRNGDSIVHSLHPTPNRSSEFSRAIAAGMKDQRLNFDRSEAAPFSVKCDLHTWMSAWILVKDHPFTAVTDSSGRFEIRNLPPGDYELRVWHERAGSLNKKFPVTIKAGRISQGDMKFGAQSIGL